MPTLPESALIVPVPAAEEVVGPWRRRLDPACRWGVPAHVTVLYPFVPPPEIDDDTGRALRALYEGEEAFDFRLEKTRWFDDAVLWVEPVPAAPFLRLTELAMRRWPDLPPYAGRFPDIVPHLTVGQEADSAVMEEAARDIRSHLPIESRADRVWLMTGLPELDSWSLHTEIPLR